MLEDFGKNQQPDRDRLLLALRTAFRRAPQIWRSAGGCAAVRQGDECRDRSVRRLTLRNAGHLVLDQPRIEAAARATVRHACRPRSPGRRCSTTIRSAARIVDSRCAITIVVRFTISASSAARTCCSLTVSRCEVASSSISIGASFRNARAMAMRCRWPPDSCTPRSPTRVAKPSGRPATNSASAAWRSAVSICSRVASGRASRTLASSVSLNR